MNRNDDLWCNFLNCEKPEDEVPEGWENKMIE
jgi:hypothetical protein